jgi:ATP-dependent DNA helicase RecQ
VSVVERVARARAATRGQPWVDAAAPGRSRDSVPSGDPAQDALFERLRELRKTLADRQRVPAYVIFSDRTLREMAQRRPSTLAALLQVSGVGPAKLEKYGEAFLEALRKG